MGFQRNVLKRTQACIQVSKAKHLQTIATRLVSQNVEKCQSWVLSKVIQQQQQVVEETFVVNEQVMDEQEH